MIQKSRAKLVIQLMQYSKEIEGVREIEEGRCSKKGILKSIPIKNDKISIFKKEIEI